jgi:hypothetical protein
MFAYYGLGPREFILLIVIALTMVLIPFAAVLAALAMARRYDGIEHREVGTH